MQFFRNEDFSWGILLIESLVIMLSVFLAFVLTGWRQSSEQKETVHKAMKNIAVEVQYNQARMEMLLPEYEFLSDSLFHIMKLKGENAPMELTELPANKGYTIPAFQGSAFETAQSTGAIAAMDFEMAQKILAAYRYQKLYSDLIDQITAGLIMGKFNTVEDWWLVFELLAGNGDFAPKLYPDVLNLLEKEYGINVENSTQSDTTTTAASPPPPVSTNLPSTEQKGLE